MRPPNTSSKRSFIHKKKKKSLHHLVDVIRLTPRPRRTERLARYIVDDFVDDNIMVLCVLKGGYKFCADLVECIKVLGCNSNKYLETRVEFIRLKSYLVRETSQEHSLTGCPNPQMKKK